MLRLSLAELRAAIYYRLHALWPILVSRPARILWRGFVWGFWLVYFSFVLAVLVLRYSVLPHIDDYRPDLERLLSKGVGLAVSIGRVEASWSGVNPALALIDVRVADGNDRPALSFSRVDAVLSWWSVPAAQLKLGLLRIDQPALHVRRDTQGQIFVAGIPLQHDGKDSGMADWVLAQSRIRINGATLVWEDEARNVPPLVLEDVSFALDNSGSRHRFGLTALPPATLAARIELRGDLRGNDLEVLETWSGEVYAAVSYADLAGWRQWVNYPVALPRGRGAMRAWLNLSEGGLQNITTDVALQDVTLRLNKTLPVLQLADMSGRVSAHISNAGFSVSGVGLKLKTQPDYASASKTVADLAATSAVTTNAVTTNATMNSAATTGARAEKTLGNKQDKQLRPTVIAFGPMDFNVDWQPDKKSDNKGFSGSASASTVDLNALSALAEYLPLDEHSRQILNDYAPRGKLSKLRAKWKGNAESFSTYSVQASFDDMALRAHSYFPGFSGITGTVDASDKGGNVTLRSTKSSIDLPSVFPESLIALDSLNALVRWKIDRGVVAAELARIEFSGPEAAGLAQGSYRVGKEGPGEIDLTATLSRADARAVWRYMPHAVGAGARQWLRDSLKSGSASDAKLNLKGNLKNFPFLDKSQGQFLITVKARDVLLDYGIGWPAISGIYGDLRFEGNGMVVEANRGTILGASLTKVRAEIPDFDKPISSLILKGRAEGETSEFLDFVEKSPVGNRIEHFTESMRASGKGVLNIDLVIPLAESELDKSKVDGVYSFTNNEITIDPAAPPLKKVNGDLSFSGKGIDMQGISATFLGGPVKIKGGTQDDGKVLVNAKGVLDVEQMRKESKSPLLEKLSGAMPYQVDVRVNGRDADVLLTSNLLGLGSTLLEPFAKSPEASIALRIDKKGLVAKKGLKGQPVREQISASLGSLAAMQIVRQKQGRDFVTEKGAIVFGRPLQLPEHGVVLGITVKNLDLDFWRRVLGEGKSTETTSAGKNTASFPVDVISVKANEVLLLGRKTNDVDINASISEGLLKLKINSTQLAGDLQWEGAGSGKLVARLKKWTMEPIVKKSGVVDADASVVSAENTPTMTVMSDVKIEAVDALPSLDVIVDEFSFGAKRFGRLEVKAHNEGGDWQIDKAQLSNPYGAINATGKWLSAAGKSRTQFDFKVDATDVGRFLTRIDYAGMVQGGTAKMEGKVGWNGRPAAFEYASLGGEFTLEASNGQFVKINPGAGGKLLGLMSLQGLTRRLSLDFKDVFGDGFAFDSINSSVAIQNGVMKVDKLQIDSPSARVQMKGDVDLQRETQRLNVNIQPELGGTAALGVALINPIAGVATWVAHKVLQNPLNHMFGFDYVVTGSWVDPKVEKVGSTSSAASPGITTVPTVLAPAANTPSRLPTISNEPGGASEPSAK